VAVQRPSKGFSRDTINLTTRIHYAGSLSDYRGITVSPAISKIFEHCLLEKYTYTVKIGNLDLKRKSVLIMLSTLYVELLTTLWKEIQL